MGCFLACFNASKHRKRRQLVNVTPSGDQRCGPSEAIQHIESTKQEDIKKPINSISESKEKLEEPWNCSSEKKVTFDLNVKEYEELSTEEVTEILVESNVEKERERKEETPKEKEVSYNLNHGYQNCTNRDDEFEDSDIEESDLDDDDDNNGDHHIWVQEESSESLFSLSIESRKQVFEVELGEKEVTSPMPICGSPKEELKAVGLDRNARDRSKYVHSVLNPVENLTQWKTAKVRASLPSKNQEKENINLEQDFDVPISLEPSFKLSTCNLKSNSNVKMLVTQEIAVDTSLSSWLVESETSPLSKSGTNSAGNSVSEKKNSSKSRKDRPILGVLTVEELKQFSASASPRRARSRSPDETPIIGTVGSYWSHTGQTMDSDSGSSSKGMLKSTSKCREVIHGYV